MEHCLDVQLTIYLNIKNEITRGKNMNNNDKKDKPKRAAIYYISDCAGADLACRI